MAIYKHTDIDGIEHLIEEDSNGNNYWDGVKINWGSDAGLIFKIGYIAIKENGVVKIRFYVNTKLHGNANYGNVFTVKINGKQAYNDMIYFNNSWYNADISKHDNLCDSTATKKCGILWNPAHIRELRQADFDTYKRWYWGNKLEFSSSEPIVEISASLTGLDLKDGSDSVKNTTAKVSSTIQNWTPVRASTPTIIDNGNNTFSVRWGNALPGINNEVTRQKCFYKFGYYDSNKEVTSDTIDLPTASASTPSVTVYAYTEATGVYGDPVRSSEINKSIKHYCIPNNAPVGTPFITTQAENRVNLTAKHPWLFWFPVGVAANASSPIAGYRLQLKVDNVSAYFSGTVKDNALIETKLNTTGTAYYCDIDSDRLDSTYMDAPDPYKEWIWHYVLIDPTTITTINGQPLKSGMSVVMQVKPYIKNGVESKLLAENYMMTAETLVHGSGVVRLFIGSGWQECPIHVKVDSTSWVEAKGIYRKTVNGWIEAK